MYVLSKNARYNLENCNMLIKQKIKTERTHPHGRVLSVLAGVAGFEPTHAAVKVLCLTA